MSAILDLVKSTQTTPTHTASRRKHRYFFIWIITGGAATTIGLIFGPLINSSRNPWLAFALAFALYGFSVLLCDVTLSQLWRSPTRSRAVLSFCLPIGAIGLWIAITVEALGPSYFSIPETDDVGLEAAIACLYLASLVWSFIAVKHVTSNSHPAVLHGTHTR